MDNQLVIETHTISLTPLDIPAFPRTSSGGEIQTARPYNVSCSCRNFKIDANCRANAVLRAYAHLVAVGVSPPLLPNE